MSPTTTTRVGEAAHALREDLHELRVATGEVAREKLTKARESVANRVREKPVQSLAIAALLGVAIGWLLHRRRD
jgi:ElaB/YqjD/DUF883 family membrane-anchored ribosome-binding protein